MFQFQQSSFSNQFTLFQKIKNLDYVLLVCILLLGIISSLSMYSTDGGEILFHTQSHVFKFLICIKLSIIVTLSELLDQMPHEYLHQ